MAFDGIMVRALRHELGTRLQDARVTKIQQTDSTELLFTFRTAAGSGAGLLHAPEKTSFRRAP